jgi:hypothetical protein
MSEMLLEYWRKYRDIVDERSTAILLISQNDVYSTLRINKWILKTHENDEEIFLFSMRHYNQFVLIFWSYSKLIKDNNSINDRDKSWFCHNENDVDL